MFATSDCASATENTIIVRSPRYGAMGNSRRVADCSTETNRPPVFVVYRTRWLVLAVCCLLSLSNCMQWISYSTLSTETDSFYCLPLQPCHPAFISNQIFQLVAVLTGLAGMYITDHYGIRLSLISGCALNCFGSLVRLLSSLPLVEDSFTRQALLHSGSFVVSMAQANFLVLPPKLAQNWFPEHQRAMAHVASCVANPLGVAMGVLVPSLLFGWTEEARMIQAGGEAPENSWNLFHFNLIMSVLCSLTFVLSLFIFHSNPPTPPSSSVDIHSETPPPFRESLVACLTNVQFLVQLVTFALGFSLLWSLVMVLPDILNANQYNLAGFPTAVCSLVGVLASLYAGCYVDRTKHFKQVIRFCSLGFLLTAIALRLFLLLPRRGLLDDITVLLLCSLLGAFSIPQFPIGAEMGVETTFPVYEATSSGLLVLSGQLWMFFLYGVFESFKRLPLLYTFDDSQVAGNWQLVLDIWIAFASLALFVSVAFLRPRYKRIEFEAKRVLAN